MLCAAATGANEGSAIGNPNMETRELVRFVQVAEDGDFPPPRYRKMDRPMHETPLKVDVDLRILHLYNLDDVQGTAHLDAFIKLRYELSACACWSADTPGTLAAS